MIFNLRYLKIVVYFRSVVMVFEFVGGATDMQAEIAVSAQLLTTAGLSTQSGLVAAEAAAQATATKAVSDSLNGSPLGTTPGIFLNPMHL